MAIVEYCSYVKQNYQAPTFSSHFFFSGRDYNFLALFEGDMII